MRWRDVKQKRVTTTKEENKKEILPKHSYASLSDRFKAFVTDSFLISMPIFYIVIYLVMNGREGFRENMLLGWGFILVPLAIIIILFYFISGQTPGLKAYDLKIIDNQTGKKPSLALAILRFLYFNVVLFTFFGLFFPFFRKDRRGIHDLLSGTSIVNI